MSLFAKLFGSKSNTGKAPTPQEAIQKLLEIEELLRKRQDVLEKKIEDELTTAKTNGVKNKRGNTNYSVLIQVLARRMFKHALACVICMILREIASRFFSKINLEVLATSQKSHLLKHA
jgi:hypothetical protein